MNEVARAPGKSALRCRVPACNSRLDPAEDDDIELQICSFCIKRPEGRRLLAAAAAMPPAQANQVAPVPAFAPAERSLIRRLRGLMPALQLLHILNERLMADRGATAAPYTLTQLESEIGGNALKPPGTDWAGLRKLLVKASRDGTLARISDQLIDDFAVVWSLNSKQVVALKDIVLGAQEDQK